MNKEEFIKQRCEIDKITEEEFEKRYRVVKCNCGQSYCKGYRCLDLDGLLKEIEQLQQENQQLKDKWNKLKEYIRKNIIYDDVGMKILDPSPLEDYMQELEQGKDD